MRAPLVALLLCTLARSAAAEPLPSGALSLILSGTGGTGADAKRIGAGLQYGGQATWQPMTTDRTWGWSLRWATLFGYSWGGTASQIGSRLETLEMDLMIGIRYRPWATPRRYLTARGGFELLRTNEPIPTASDPDMMHRSFLGGVGSVGLDQYLGNFGALLDIDVRYGSIGGGPTQLALVVGIGVTGP